jgi:hypothetical protein
LHFLKRGGEDFVGVGACVAAEGVQVCADGAGCDDGILWKRGDERADGLSGNHRKINVVDVYGTGL